MIESFEEEEEEKKEEEEEEEGGQTRRLLETRHQSCAPRRKRGSQGCTRERPLTGVCHGGAAT